LSAEDNDEFPLKRQPKYYESGSSSEEDQRSTISVDDEGDSAQGDNDDSDDGDDKDGPVRVYSESEMGTKGGPFTDADLYIAAKYVAFFSDFENATARERWDPYHELVSEISSSCLKHHSDFTSIPNGRQKPGLNIIVDTSTVRSDIADCRGQTYPSAAIKRLGARIRRQENSSGSIDSRRARPSWASNSSRWKRKHEEVGEEGDEGGKRSRGN
jgi:hypothetical protein